MAEKKQYEKKILDRLNADKDFQHIVSNDKELADLFNTPEKTEEDSELEFFSAMGGRFTFEGGAFKPISAGIISLLSLFNSPFVVRGRKISVSDVDLAMLVLCYGKEVLEFGTMKDIRKTSEGFCAVMEIDPSDAAQSIIKAIRISFMGLAYIMGGTPQKEGETGQENNPLDLEWLTRQISMAHDICGYDPDYTKWELSMSELSYIACQKARQGGRIISRPKKADLVFDRLHFLMDQQIAKYEAKK